MTTTVLAADITATESTDQTITAGTKKSFFLTCAAGVEEIPKTAVILCQRKSGSDYVTVKRMTYHEEKCGIIVEATNSDLIVRFKRGLQDKPVGVDQE